MDDGGNIGKAATNKRREQKDKDIAARYKLLDREIQQECKQAKEEHYNHLCAEIEVLDKHYNPIMYSKVKSMEHTIPPPWPSG